MAVQAKLKKIRMSEQLEKVSHDFIRYANCWEDTDILLEALNISNGDRVLSIGSAGDNSLSMLVNNPELVVAVDVNYVQLYLIELKIAAIKALDHEEYLAFIGFRASNSRMDLFEHVKSFLKPNLIKYWEGRKSEIVDGLIDQGKFEKYFYAFRTKVLPLIHSKKRINQLFEPKSKTEQQEFFDNKWNTWKWKMLFKIFFSKFVMGKLGRDPEFLKEVKISVSNFILQQAAGNLSSKACQNNYYLQYILKGEFETNLPHYARAINYNVIKANINKIEVFRGLAEDAFSKYSRFNKFNLSNIFEYMPADIFESVSSSLRDNSAPNSRFAYWNLMVPRRMSAILPEFEYQQRISSLLNKKDNTFFYSQFVIDVKK